MELPSLLEGDFGVNSGLFGQNLEMPTLLVMLLAFKPINFVGKQTQKNQLEKKKKKTPNHYHRIKEHEDQTQAKEQKPSNQQSTTTGSNHRLRHQRNHTQTKPSKE